MTQPSIGDLIYLASYVIRVRVSALSTPPDTPDQYTADLHVMGDQGAMVLDALAGPAGPGGLQEFAFRRQDDANVNSQADLPTDLQNLPEDIGRYWLIDTIDSEGVVTAETAWTWYGTGWRTFLMGVVGAPGAVPDIDVTQTLIPPGQDSYVDTTGTTITPSWEFKLAEPAGPAGPIYPLYVFPDVDTSTPAAANDVLIFDGHYTEAGAPVWAPFNMEQLLPGFYSMPESAFTAYTGISQQAPIGSFVIPPQPYDWTPVVWGHVGMTGVNLAAETQTPQTPTLMIGAQVLLGHQTNGTLIARGMGSPAGRVVIYPHYSGSGFNYGTPNAFANSAITPNNQYAMVPAHHTDPTQGTLYVNLWNDGQLSAYNYTPGGSQLFIAAVPVNLVAQHPWGTLTS